MTTGYGVGMLDYFQGLIANCASKWRPVVGYEGLYEVSVDGEIRSLDRTIRRPQDQRDRFLRGKTMKGVVAWNKYVIMTFCKNGVVKPKMAHRVVAEAHIGTIPDGIDIDHKNGVRDDNRLDNLRFATRSQNLRNKVANRGASGHRGISYRPKQVNKWSVRITINGFNKQIGSFPTRDNAIAARLAAELKYWGNDAPSMVRT